jgi:hypothetical protein
MLSGISFPRKEIGIEISFNYDYEPGEKLDELNTDGASCLEHHESELKFSTGSDSSSITAAWKQSAASVILPSDLCTFPK